MHCKQSIPVERAEEARSPSLRAGAAGILGPPAGQHRPLSVTLPSEEASYLPGGLMTAREPVVALSPRKVRPPTPATHRVRPEIGAPAGASERRVEYHGSTLWSHPFASKRFHVLLNSLFKVLFNFPSRYLSAIGLVSVFSLRWSLPPTLGCIPKQPDSKNATRDGGRHHRGLTPALGKAPIRRTRTPTTAPSAVLNTTVPAYWMQGDSVLGYSRFTRRYWGNPC